MDKKLLDAFFLGNYSMQQIHLRFNLLRTYLICRFFQEKQEDTLAVDPADRLWLASLGQTWSQQCNKRNVYQIIESLEKEIGKIKPLVIYISFDMPDEEIEKLGIWLRGQFAPNGSERIVFEIKHDPNLIGGCALSWRGVYRDYSVRAKIEANKEKILASFKTFLH